MSKIYLNHTKQVIDRVTGEVTEVTNSMIRQTAGEDSYVKVYLDRDFSGLTDKEYRLLHELCLLMSYKSRVDLTGVLKKELCRVCRIKSLASLYVLLNSLVKKGHLVGEKGEYFLNARHFGKGSWSDIKLLRGG